MNLSPRVTVNCNLRVTVSVFFLKLLPYYVTQSNVNSFVFVMCCSYPILNVC